MTLRRQVLRTEILDPRRGFAQASSRIEVRWDPLTGHGARLVQAPGALLPASDFDLRRLGEELQSTCPFCASRLEDQTPRFPPALCEQGRFHHGQAVLFPNLLAYSRYSSVSVYSPSLHFLPLQELTADLVADNLAVQVQFERAVIRHDPEARWASINANHMLPSGSSVFHPHLQGSVDPSPTTFQRLLAEVPRERFDGYLQIEREQGERHLGSTGRVEWLASFAPLAPGELRAFIPEVCSPSELDDELVEELAHGIAAALSLYSELGHESFNMAIYGAPPGTTEYPLNLRIACRQNPAHLYRSDVTYLERLHWEAAIDISPEELAARAGDRFRA